MRVRGLRTLRTFLEKLQPKTLQSTGLSSVVEEAVLPTLMYLPSLTPEAESVQLLRPAYAALLALADSQASREEKERLLDKTLRDGVFAAFFYAREHVRIVEVLGEQTALILQALGLGAVKHLKVRQAPRHFPSPLPTFPTNLTKVNT